MLTVFVILDDQEFQFYLVKLKQKLHQLDFGRRLRVTFQRAYQQFSQKLPCF